MSAAPDTPREMTPLAAELVVRGMRARTLARAAGVHENSVYNWAAGKATPTVAKAARVADALGVPVDRLFPDADTDRRERRARRRLPPRLLPNARPSAQVSEQDRYGISRELTAAMARSQLTHRALADALQVNPATVGGWLSGRHLPAPDTAPAVAAAVGMPLERLQRPERPPSPLQAAAAQRGWGARELAQVAGVETDTAMRWLTGSRMPALGHATRVAAALDRPLDELFDLAPADQPQPAHAPEPQGPRTLSPSEALEVSATGRPDWRDDAACAAPHADPEQWWPTGDDPAFEARTTCAGCPVLGDCRDAYLASPDTPEDRTAIWAGVPGGRLRTAARASARDGRALDAAPRREHSGNQATATATPPPRKRDAAPRPADAARRRELAASARVSRDLRARVASDRADPATVRARTTDPRISL